MSYNNLLSLLSPQRREFIYKINNEMYNNALVNSDRESIKDYFFSLVRKNKELSGNEKKYSKKKFIYEFELSNAIYESGKPRECNECGSTRYSDKFCESCISLQLQSLFITWTSGNSIINDFIQQCQMESSLPGYILEWIPFEQFGDITKLADGGFSSIYTAAWSRGAICDYNENEKEFSYFGNQEVVLKSLNNSNNPGKSFFYEAINYCKIKSSTIVPCYGITKFPDYGNYAIVLSYAPEGNLRSYLQKNHSDLTLKNKITIFRYLCDALYWIHEKDLIHCDLHSGNILLQGGCCYITDLGLCGPVDEKSSNKIYGIISYVAPELLKGKINTKNTKESDIYSVGMLMWEIFAGHPPFDDRAHDHHLIFDICEGLQPPIHPEMPDDYAEIMQKCWDMDPSKRPTIEELFDFAENKLKEVHTAETLKNNRNSLIKKLFRFSKIKKHEIGFNYSRNSSGSIGRYSRYSQRAHKSHPDAYHISRILDEEITKFKILNNSSLLNNLDLLSNVDINKDYRNYSKEKED